MNGVRRELVSGSQLNVQSLGIAGVLRLFQKYLPEDFEAIPIMVLMKVILL